MKNEHSLIATLLVLLAATTSVTSFTHPARPFISTPLAQRNGLICSATVQGDALTEEEGGAPSKGDNDLHPSDDASTTPQFLAGLWQLIARGNHMVRGVSS